MSQPMVAPVEESLAPTGDPDILDPVEAVARDYLHMADENPSLALRLAVCTILTTEGRVRERERLISHGFVRGSLERLFAKGTR